MITLESETLYVDPNFPIHYEWINNGIITSGKTIDNLLRNIKSSSLDVKENILFNIEPNKKRILEKLEKGDVVIYTPNPHSENKTKFFLSYKEE